MAKKTQQTFEVTITNNGATGLAFGDLFKVKRGRALDSVKLIKSSVINVPTPASKTPKNPWIQGFGTLLKKALLENGLTSCKTNHEVRSSVSGFKITRFNSGNISVTLSPTITYSYCRYISIRLEDNKAGFSVPVSIQSKDWVGNVNRWEKHEISLSDPECIKKVMNTLLA